MSDCNDQKNKPIDDGSTVDAKKPIGDWRLITTTAAMDLERFFVLRALGVGQYDALLASMSLVYFDELYMMIKKNIQ